jgi:hypothetical protein
LGTAAPLKIRRPKVLALLGCASRVIPGARILSGERSGWTVEDGEFVADDDPSVDDGRTLHNAFPDRNFKSEEFAKGEQ